MLVRPTEPGSTRPRAYRTSANGNETVNVGAGRTFDRDGPTMGRHDVLGDGEPEPGAAVVRACVVESGEAFEDPFSRRASGMPGPSSTTRQRDRGLDSRERTTTIVRARVACRVVEQVARPRVQSWSRVAVAPARPTRPACRRDERVRRRGRRASASTISSRSTGLGSAASSAETSSRPACEQVVDQALQRGSRRRARRVRWPRQSASSGCARSTSSCARIPVSGLRSSWLASATNRRWRSVASLERGRASRSSCAARRPISSSRSGLGHAAVRGPSPPITSTSAADRFDRPQAPGRRRPT